MKTCSLTSSSTCSRLGGRRLPVGEVEAQLVRAHGGAGLLDVLAQDAPQRLVQQVGRGVVRHRREAHRPGHDRLDLVAHGEAVTFEEERLVVPEPKRLPQLGPRTRLLVLEPAGVGDLTAAGRVEGRALELASNVPSPSSLRATIAVNTSVCS